MSASIIILTNSYFWFPLSFCPKFIHLNLLFTQDYLTEADLKVDGIRLYLLFWRESERRGKTGSKYVVKNLHSFWLVEMFDCFGLVPYKHTNLIALNNFRELPFFKETILCMFDVENLQIYYRTSTILFFLLSVKKEDKNQ